MKRRETLQAREFLNLPLQRDTKIYHCGLLFKSLKVKEREEEEKEKKVRPAGAGVKGRVKESIGNHIRRADDECKNAVIPEIIEIPQVRAIIGKDVNAATREAMRKQGCVHLAFTGALVSSQHQKCAQVY